MNPALSRYPFHHPFLPGAGWLPAGGVLTAPSLPPSMFPLDTKSPFKHVFNPLLRYPFPISQPLKAPFSQPSVLSVGGAGGVNQATPIPQGAQGVMYPIAANPPGFGQFGVSEVSGGANGPMAPTTPPILQMPNQPQPFPGMIPPPILSGVSGAGGGKDDKPEDKLQGLNWMQNPTLMGSGLGMMPYFMGQGQIGAAAAAGLNMQPPGQPAMGLIPLSAATNLPSSPLAGPADKAKDASGGSSLMARKMQQVATPLRRSSSTSLDALQHEAAHRTGDMSPSNTPPLGGSVGVKKFPLVPDTASKWKSMGEQSMSPKIMMPQYSMQGSVNTPSPFSASATPLAPPGGHIIANLGQMIPMGFHPPPPQPPPGTPVVGGRGGSPGPHVSGSKAGRGDGHGSPRTSDKMKLRIHHVRDDDFKTQVKTDRRRRKWRGKDNYTLLSSRAELAESAVRRMGFYNNNTELPAVSQSLTPPTLTKDSTPIPALPASLGVEPGSRKAPGAPSAPVPGMERHVPLTSSATPTVSGHSDGNYALNMLADMSSIQQSKEKPPQANVDIMPPPATSSDASSSRPYLRSPVSVAARSLLMLGEDLNLPREKSHGAAAVTGDKENTAAANSLLQLSGAVYAGSTSSALPGSTASVLSGAAGLHGATGVLSGGPGAALSTGSVLHGAIDKTVEEEQEEEDVVISDKAEAGEKEPPQARSTRSASFSAAEAMILMGTGNEEMSSQTSPPFNKLSLAPTAEALAPHTPTHPAKKITKPRSLTVDSEATDTDSEATLTPETPGIRRGYMRLPSLVTAEEKMVHEDSAAVVCPEDMVCPGEVCPGDTRQAEGRTEGEDIDVVSRPEIPAPVGISEDSEQPPSAEADQHPMSQSPPPFFNRSPRQAVFGEESENILAAPSTNQGDNEREVTPGMPIFSPLVTSPTPPPPPPPGQVQDDPLTPPPAKRSKFISSFEPATDTAVSMQGVREEGGIESADPALESTKAEVDAGVAVGRLMEDNTPPPPSPTPAVLDSPSESGQALMDSPIAPAQEVAAQDTSLATAHEPEHSPHTVAHVDSPHVSNSPHVSDSPHGDAVTTRETDALQAAEESNLDSQLEAAAKDEPTETSNSKPVAMEDSTSKARTDLEKPVPNAAEKKASSSSSLKKYKVKRVTSMSDSGKPKTRVIKIKRAKSPKHSSTQSPKEQRELADTDASSAPPAGISSEPTSWAAFAEEVSKDSVGGGGVRSRTGTSKGAHIGGGNDKTSKELEPSEQQHISEDVTSALQEPSKTTADAPSSKSGTSQGSGGIQEQGSNPPPQNRLKIASHGSHKHRSHLSKPGRDSDSEEKRRTHKAHENRAPGHEGRGKELFSADQPSSKKEGKKESGVMKIKKHKASRSRSPLVGPYNTDLGTRLPAERVQHPPQPRSRHVSESDDEQSAQGHLQTHSRAHEQDSSRPRGIFSNSAVKERHAMPTLSPRPALHAPSSNRECEFSPLSDDEFRIAPSPSKSVKWTEEESWKQKAHRHHQSSLEDAPLPSPASSLSSSSAKKHHHQRHHDRPGGEHKGEKSSSRGTTPEERKRHHKHHRRHHHSHEGRFQDPASHYSSSVPPSSVGSGSSQKEHRPYESISEDDTLVTSSHHRDDREGRRRNLHEEALTRSMKQSGAASVSGHRKRFRISSEDSEDESEFLPPPPLLPPPEDKHNEGQGLGTAPERSGGSGSGSKHKKAKHSKEHSSKSSHKDKERWKEGSNKHKHSRKQH